MMPTGSGEMDCRAERADCFTVMAASMMGTFPRGFLMGKAASSAPKAGTTKASWPRNKQKAMEHSSSKNVVIVTKANGQETTPMALDARPGRKGGK